MAQETLIQPESPLVERLEQLRELFPEVFEEGVLNPAKLTTLLGQTEPGKERYELTWAGKSEMYHHLQVPSYGTLLPKVGQSVAFDTAENLIVEGDNLEVLKLLQKSYHGKVKMIFIDPPYNTGSEFIYPDNFREGLDDYLRYSGQVDDEGLRTTTVTDRSGRYHSKWLNMMYPRLFLARNLLRQDGSIFVSIDDHELHDLKLLLNEIFGEENFVAQVEWQKRYTRSNNTDNFTSVIDHILIYGRSSQFKVNLLERNKEANARFSNPDNDPRGPWKATPILNQVAPEKRPNLCYPIVNPYTGTVTHPDKKAWRHDKSTFERLGKEGRLWWGVNKDKKVPDVKVFLSDVRQGMTPINFWEHQYAGNTDNANAEIKEIFGDKVFDTPKPTLLVMRMLEHATNPDTKDIVLDFFAGSGTTAHGVIRQNLKDSGNRRFILVQLPEPIQHETYHTIAEITRERVRRVINKEELDVGFRSLSLSDSNFRVWEEQSTPHDELALREQLALFSQNYKSGRSDLDVVYEAILRSGYPLTVAVEAVGKPDWHLYSVSQKELYVCLAEAVDEQILNWVISERPASAIFLDHAFRENDTLKTNTVLRMQALKISFRTI